MANELQTMIEVEGLTKLYGFLNNEIKLGSGIDCIKAAYKKVYPDRYDACK